MKRELSGFSGRRIWEMLEAGSADDSRAYDGFSTLMTVINRSDHSDLMKSYLNG